MPPVVKVEKVKAKCGHEIEFPHFEDKKDKYRDQRRNKQMSRDCPACRQAKQDAQVEAGKERRKRKAQEKKAKGTGRNVGRLPHRSRFEVEYDSHAETWVGSLFIRPESGPTEVFQGDASGVFKLLERLDRQYRRWLEKQTPPPSSEVPPPT